MAATKNAFYSNSFLIFIIRFFPSLANLVVMVYFSKGLPAATYGQYTNFWVHVSIFYPVICFGLHALIMTYSGDVLVSLIRNITSKQLYLYGAWACLLAAVFALLEWHTLHIHYVVAFLFVLSFALSFILESLLMAFKSFSVLIAINIAYSAGYLLLHRFVLQHGFVVANMFNTLLFVIVLRCVSYFVYLIYKINQYPKNSPDNMPAPAKLRSLWLHLSLYDIVQNFSVWVDKFIISLVFTTGVSAAYYNGSQNIPFIPLLISAAGSAILIQLAGGGKDTEKEYTINLMNQSGRVLACIVFPVFFFLLFFSHELFTRIFPRYEAAVPVFIASLFILPVRAYNFTTVLQRMHKGAIINKGAIGEIVLAILLMYPLYLWLGLPGLALSFVISTYLQATYYIISTAQLMEVAVWRLMPLGNWLLKFVAVGVVLFVVHYYVGQYLTGYSALFIGGGAMVVMMGGLLLVETRKGAGH